MHAQYNNGKLFKQWDWNAFNYEFVNIVIYTAPGLERSLVMSVCMLPLLKLVQK